MKTQTVARGALISAWAIRKVRRSARVAEWLWNASFVALAITGMSYQLLPFLGSIAVFVAATRHRTKVERKN